MARHFGCGLSKVLQIWVLSDGKPGHENQAMGLAEAMGRRVKVCIRLIRLNMELGLLGRIGRVLEEVRGYERPDYVMGAGHGTHLALLFVSRKHDACSIVLMKPGLPMCLFDWCVIPEHDFMKVPEDNRVILSKGALNRVVPCVGRRSGRMILVGGPSKIHGFDEAALLGSIREIAGSEGWMVADSRRTPEGFLERVRRNVPWVEIFPHQESEPGWLAARLATVEEVWVTEDSVSMIYEALTGGGRVGVIGMPRLRETARVIRGLDNLKAEGYFQDAGDAQGNGRVRLAEADRCAAIILDRDCKGLVSLR